MSTRSFPGTATAPWPSTCASSDARSEISISVAASSSESLSARSSTPARICTVIRDETPRATVESLATSSSRVQVTFIPVPTTVSTLDIL
jgi:hypothetical protein